MWQHSILQKVDRLHYFPERSIVCSHFPSLAPHMHVGATAPLIDCGFKLDCTQRTADVIHTSDVHVITVKHHLSNFCWSLSQVQPGSSPSKIYTCLLFCPGIALSQ